MNDEPTIQEDAAEPTELVAFIDVSLIDPNPLQPRGEVQPADLEELSISIKNNGLLQPLLVSPHQDRYFLVAGYRRLSAAKAIGCLLYTSPSPRDRTRSRMPSSA